MAGLPFTSEQFFAVFAAYNAAIWPAQIIAYALGVAAVISLLVRWKHAAAFALGVLAVLWAWNGVAYHFYHFAVINIAAYLFSALFLAQAGLLAAAAFPGERIRVEAPRVGYAVAAWALMLYALVIYELLGHLAGHGSLEGPLFGVAPCPTTIFTIAVLLLLRGNGVFALSIIPFAWAIVGTSTAIVLSVPEDLGLAVAAVALAARWLDRQGSVSAQNTSGET
ncbi:MAG: DUF6064 family protein [Dichotomicrobium sp.]